MKGGQGRQGREGNGPRRRLSSRLCRGQRSSVLRANLRKRGRNKPQSHVAMCWWRPLPGVEDAVNSLALPSCPSSGQSRSLGEGPQAERYRSCSRWNPESGGPRTDSPVPQIPPFPGSSRPVHAPRSPRSAPVGLGLQPGAPPPFSKPQTRCGGRHHGWGAGPGFGLPVPS